MSKPITVREMVRKALVDGGFDGLYDSMECACLVDDLMPCEVDSIMNCEAGYKIPGPIKDCYICGDNCVCEWHVGPTKPAAMGEEEEEER